MATSSTSTSIKPSLFGAADAPLPPLQVVFKNDKLYHMTLGEELHNDNGVYFDISSDMFGIKRAIAYSTSDMGAFIEYVGHTGINYNLSKISDSQHEIFSSQHSMPSVPIFVYQFDRASSGFSGIKSNNTFDAKPVIWTGTSGTGVKQLTN